jgi:hypothetical protein
MNVAVLWQIIKIKVQTGSDRVVIFRTEILNGRYFFRSVSLFLRPDFY